MGAGSPPACRAGAAPASRRPPPPHHVRLLKRPARAPACRPPQNAPGPRHTERHAKTCRQAKPGGYRGCGWTRLARHPRRAPQGSRHTPGLPPRPPAPRARRNAGGPLEHAGYSTQPAPGPSAGKNRAARTSARPSAQRAPARGRRHAARRSGARLRPRARRLPLAATWAETCNARPWGVAGSPAARALPHHREPPSCQNPPQRNHAECRSTLPPPRAHAAAAAAGPGGRPGQIIRACYTDLTEILPHPCAALRGRRRPALIRPQPCRLRFSTGLHRLLQTYRGNKPYQSLADAWGAASACMHAREGQAAHGVAAAAGGVQWPQGPG